MDASRYGMPTINTLKELLEEDQGGDIQSVFHLGDVAYNLEDDNGQRGDDYFR